MSSSVSAAAASPDLAHDLARPTTVTAITASSWRNQLHQLCPNIYAHRGDPTLYPENTLAAHRAAALAGATHLEPDLVLTKDAVLVVHHGFPLNQTTNVASLPEFQSRKRDLMLNMPEEYKQGVTMSQDWFVEDFTLEELRQLTVKFPGNSSLDVANGIPTFEEYLVMVKQVNEELNRSVGLILDIKHSFHHNQRFPDTPSGHFFEDEIVEALKRHGYLDWMTQEQFTPPTSPPDTPNIPSKSPPLIIESFERPSLVYIRSLIPFSPSHIHLSLLVGMHWNHLTHADLVSTKSAHIERVCIAKQYLIYPLPDLMKRWGGDWVLGKGMQWMGIIGNGNPKTLVNEVHELGLYLDAYTFKRAKEDKDDDKWIKETQWAIGELGLDGVFVEGMQQGIDARARLEHGV